MSWIVAAVGKSCQRPPRDGLSSIDICPPVLTSTTKINHRFDLPQTPDSFLTVRVNWDVVVSFVVMQLHRLSIIGLLPRLLENLLRPSWITREIPSILVRPISDKRKNSKKLVKIPSKGRDYTFLHSLLLDKTKLSPTEQKKKPLSKLELLKHNFEFGSTDFVFSL